MAEGWNPQEERRKGQPKTDRERFMEHYGLTDEQMDKILEWIGEDVYKLLHERGKGLAQEEEGERERLHKEAEASARWREQRFRLKL